MKATVNSTHAQYVEPQPGELRHRVWLQQTEEQPAANFATERVVTEQVKVWGKLVAVSGAAYLAAMQTEAKVTHKLVIRYRLVDRFSEVEHGGSRYRIKRVQPLNGRAEWVMLDLEELTNVSIQ